MLVFPGLDFETHHLERTATWSSSNFSNVFFLRGKIHKIYFLKTLTCVAEVDELFGEQVCEQLHDEQQVLVLVLLGCGIASLPALVVFGVDLQQR